MFEKASRLKVRFDSGKGQLTIEDLWDLPLTSNANRANLDDIARGLHKQLKNDDDVSFVIKDKKSDTTVQLKFDIVKHIIEIRLAEDEARSKAHENSVKKQSILQLIAERQNEELKGKSLDDLKAMVAELS
jgi:hypothetical protein